jgi:hypothetical protein
MGVCRNKSSSQSLRVLVSNYYVENPLPPPPPAEEALQLPPPCSPVVMVRAVCQADYLVIIIINEQKMISEFRKQKGNLTFFRAETLLLILPKGLGVLLDKTGVGDPLTKLHIHQKDTPPVRLFIHSETGSRIFAGCHLLTSRRVDDWVSTYHSWEQPRCPHDSLQLKGSGIHAPARPVTPRRNKGCRARLHTIGRP